MWIFRGISMENNKDIANFNDLNTWSWFFIPTDILIRSSHTPDAVFSFLQSAN